MSYLWELAINYLFIQFSILFFILPFYIAYKFINHDIKFRHLALNSHIKNFLSSPAANYLIFTWAAAEAICWFVIPEFLLLLVIFLKVRNKIKLLAFDILGTTVGTVLGLILSLYLKIDLTRVPYITQNMINQVQAWYGGLGSLALLYQPFSGVPYKVFVLTAYGSHLNLVWFLILAIAVRLARYYIFYLLFVGLYPFLYRLISKNYLPIFLISCFIFSILFLKVYNSYGPEYTINNQDIQKMKSIILLIKGK